MSPSVTTLSLSSSLRADPETGCASAASCLQLTHLMVVSNKHPEQLLCLNKMLEGPAILHHT